ncbi:MAG TPA: hypothetical protein VHL08_04565 [Dongiaceae bacterium]|jgi:hypothetical protein|nr:hypothetical protein [Dongiaceae bacterium]
MSADDDDIRLTLGRILGVLELRDRNDRDQREITTKLCDRIQSLEVKIATQTQRETGNERQIFAIRRDLDGIISWRNRLIGVMATISLIVGTFGSMLGEFLHFRFMWPQ